MDKKKIKGRAKEWLIFAAKGHYTAKDVFPLAPLWYLCVPNYY